MFFSRKKLQYKHELLHLEYRSSRDIANYIRFYADEKRNVFKAFSFWLVKTTPDWVLPVMTANIINVIEFKPSDSVQQLVLYSVIAMIVILQHTPSQFMCYRFLSRANRAIEMKLRSSLCLRLQHLSIPYHKNSKLGILQTKILRDVENIQGLTSLLMEGIPFTVLTIIISLTMTAIRAPKFLIFFALMVPVAVLINKLTIRKIRQYNSDFRISVENMSGKVIEMLRMITVTRAHNVENTELDSVKSKLQVVRDNGLKLDMLNAVYGSVNWVTFTLFSTLTLITAAYMDYIGFMKIGIGDIVLLTTYFNSLSHMIMNLLNLFPQIMRALESVKSITEVLECPDIEINEDKPPVSSIEGHFTFDDVSFAYDDDKEHPAIKNFSLEIKPGETIAFVGPSGSGKSTLMQLLIGFIRPTAGTLYIDNHNVNDIDLRSYRRFISVVSQESVLFDGSIKENITYGIDNPTDEHIAEAVRCAGLEDFVNSLPDGLNTLVKENGARLSGGQKQRISIARALLRDPKVLLLDEATSALDVESEALIQNALDHLIEGRTTFIVAHRLSTIRNADRIVVLTKGEISEIGTHEELLAKQGIYYRMTLLQSKEISGDRAAQIALELEKAVIAKS